jgi:hypothetical protein
MIFEVMNFFVPSQAGMERQSSGLSSAVPVDDEDEMSLAGDGSIKVDQSPPPTPIEKPLLRSGSRLSRVSPRRAGSGSPRRSPRPLNEGRAVGFSESFSGIRRLGTFVKPPSLRISSVAELVKPTEPPPPENTCGVGGVEVQPAPLLAVSPPTPFYETNRGSTPISATMTPSMKSPAFRRNSRYANVGLEELLSRGATQQVGEHAARHDDTYLSASLHHMALLAVGLYCIVRPHACCPEPLAFLPS